MKETREKSVHKKKSSSRDQTVEGSYAHGVVVDLVWGGHHLRPSRSDWMRGRCLLRCIVVIIIVKEEEQEEQEERVEQFDDKPFVALHRKRRADEDDDEEEEISCAKIIFWVQLNGKMLDVTQQEDLRAFLQASLLPENNSIIDGETSSTQTTEDLFKEYTPELTPEKLSGTYVGTTERVLAKNKEQLSTMPNIYGQAAMSELKLLRKKPNA